MNITETACTRLLSLSSTYSKHVLSFMFMSQKNGFNCSVKALFISSVFRGDLDLRETLVTRVYLDKE